MYLGCIAADMRYHITVQLVPAILGIKVDSRRYRQETPHIIASCDIL